MNAGRATRTQATLSAFVLHHYNWSESSLVLDLFTRELGRIAVVAKGAKRPYSQLRSVLLPFQRLNVSLSKAVKSAEGMAEVQTLRGAEWVGGTTLPGGAAIFSAYYLNELLLKLLARQDPHPQLFDAYALALAQLSRKRRTASGLPESNGGRPGQSDGLGALAGRRRAAPSLPDPLGGRPAQSDGLGALNTDDDTIGQSALRAFELVLLREIGLLPDLSLATLTQTALSPERDYALSPHSGVIAPGADAFTLSGATLIHLQAALEHGSHAALMQACGTALPALRVALRGLLYHHLGHAPLRTRQVMLDLQKLME